VLVGVGYSVYSVVMLSQITYLALPQIQGTAYGILFTVINVAKVATRILLNQQYDSGVVDLSSFDPKCATSALFDGTCGATMEHDFLTFWKTAAGYLDHVSLVLVCTAAAAIPIVALAYCIDFKQRGGVLQNRGSFKTDQEFKRYFWTKQGFF
jgi:hypothetical protein